MGEFGDGRPRVRKLLPRDPARREGEWSADPYAVDAAERFRAFVERDQSPPDERWFRANQPWASVVATVAWLRGWDGS